MDTPLVNGCEEKLRGLIRQYGSRITQLPCKPEETIEATVRALWLCALGVRTSSVQAMGLALAPLSPEQDLQLVNLLQRRARGEPLAYLTQRQQFLGLQCKCGPGALIPRKETELLGRAGCRLLTEEILPQVQQPRVLDLCTGSGNVACAIACHVPQCRVFASDISPEASHLAHENACALACGDRLQIFVGDLFAPFEREIFAKSFDLILCNPPYISTTKVPLLEREIALHEPRIALEAGPFGLGILTRLLRDAPDYTKPGGWLAFEVGRGQGSGILRRLARDRRFRSLSGLRDAHQEVRAVAAQVAFN